MAESRSSGLGVTFLVGGVLLVAAVLLLVLVPLADCPECKGGYYAVVTKVETPTGDEIEGCTTCDDRTKVPHFKKWTYRAPGGGP